MKKICENENKKASAQQTNTVSDQYTTANNVFKLLIFVHCCMTVTSRQQIQHFESLSTLYYYCVSCYVHVMYGKSSI